MKPRHRLAYYSFYLFSIGSMAGLTWCFLYEYKDSIYLLSTNNKKRGNGVTSQIMHMSSGEEIKKGVSHGDKI